MRARRCCRYRLLWRLAAELTAITRAQDIKTESNRRIGPAISHKVFANLYGIKRKKDGADDADADDAEAEVDVDAA